jgi:hypothetical protein
VDDSKRADYKVNGSLFRLIVCAFGALACAYQHAYCAEPDAKTRANIEFMIQKERELHGDRAITLAQPYLSRLIEYMPEGADKELLRKQHPILWVGYGFETCQMLDEGKRESTLRTSLDSFYGPNLGRAIVQAAKDVICPKYKGPSVNVR